jgi:hypothetical protein
MCFGTIVHFNAGTSAGFGRIDGCSIKPFTIGIEEKVVTRLYGRINIGKRQRFRNSNCIALISIARKKTKAERADCCKKSFLIFLNY